MLQIVGTVYKIHLSKVSIIGDASCMRFNFLYIVAIFYDVNSLSGSLKYTELSICTVLSAGVQWCNNKEKM